MKFPSFTMSKDGTKRVDIRLKFRLGRDDLESVAANGRLRGQFNFAENEENLTPGEVWRGIKETLENYGSSALTFDEVPYSDEYAGWAKEQIAKIVPKD